MSQRLSRDFVKDIGELFGGLEEACLGIEEGVGLVVGRVVVRMGGLCCTGYAGGRAKEKLQVVSEGAVGRTPGVLFVHGAVGSGK